MRQKTVGEGGCKKNSVNTKKDSLMLIFNPKKGVDDGYAATRSYVELSKDKNQKATRLKDSLPLEYTIKIVRDVTTQGGTGRPRLGLVNYACHSC